MVHAMGYRFRLHRSDLPGKPDLVFPARMKIIEVKGCFWHQHGRCIDSHIPKSRGAYWRPKLENNVRRDKRNVRALRRLGWRVLIVWECEAKSAADEILRRKLRNFLRKR
jgi:DNA mismatch endonuclease (patch repair protein)